MTEDQTLLWSKKQTAAALSTSERNVDLMVAAGKLPTFVTLGSCRRWRARELTAWINAGCPPVSEWVWPRPASENHETAQHAGLDPRK